MNLMIGHRFVRIFPSNHFLKIFHQFVNIYLQECFICQSFFPETVHYTVAIGLRCITFHFPNMFMHKTSIAPMINIHITVVLTNGVQSYS